MSRKHYKTNGFGTPLFIHAKNPHVLYAKFEMKPFQTYLSWFHFKETLQNQCFQQPEFSIQAQIPGCQSKV